MTHDDRMPAMRDIERALAELPGQLPFPTTPDIASRIGAALPERRPAPLRRPTTWYAVAAVLLTLVVLAAALPGPRRAVADFFGLPGIRIEVGPATDGAGEAPTSIGSSLLFGERTTLDGARNAVAFPILLPTTDGTAEPDEVYLRDTNGVVAVSLLYAASPGLPEIGTTGVGMLLMEFRTRDDVPFLAKRAMGDGTLTVVTFVEGREAYWITNGELVVQPPDLGAPGPSGLSRRSGNVLIWSDGATTYRLETALDREAAIRIAESLVP